MAEVVDANAVLRTMPVAVALDTQLGIYVAAKSSVVFSSAVVVRRAFSLIRRRQTEIVCASTSLRTVPVIVALHTEFGIQVAVISAAAPPNTIMVGRTL